jgi:hypothetical protein
MRLTDTQLVLLSAASQREDRSIELAPNLKGAASHKVVRKLLGEGLIEEIAAGGSLPVCRVPPEELPLKLHIRCAYDVLSGICRGTDYEHSTWNPAGTVPRISMLILFAAHSRPLVDESWRPWMGNAVGQLFG